MVNAHSYRCRGTHLWLHATYRYKGDSPRYYVHLGILVATPPPPPPLPHLAPLNVYTNLDSNVQCKIHGLKGSHAILLAENYFIDQVQLDTQKHHHLTSTPLLAIMSHTCSIYIMSNVANEAYSLKSIPLGSTLPSCNSLDADITLYCEAY